jgi:hypothetical protein
MMETEEISEMFVSNSTLTGEDLTPEYSPLIGPRKFCSLFMEKIN